MAYKLEKPYTIEQRIEFIVNYNHTMGLDIEETDSALFALFPNEIMSNGEAIVDENYEQKMAQKREENFKKMFFNTTLGWIRRKVNMKDGSQKDFLSDLLLPIKAGLELGNSVEIITYQAPDFSNEITDEYLVSLQEVKPATLDFVRECLNQTVTDFCGE